jgi:ring-1,2-phenylacetyl-CoA epoxidase subunit PaaD
MGQIEDDIHAALAALDVPVRVLTQLAPAWTTDWMTPTARDKLRRYGIAPPQGSSESAPGAATVVVRFASRRAQAGGVPCPQCGSGRTTETSHFSSTACKALYKCLDCMEPFDYFKPY